MAIPGVVLGNAMHKKHHGNPRGVLVCIPDLSLDADSEGSEWREFIRVVEIKIIAPVPIWRCIIEYPTLRAVYPAARSELTVSKLGKSPSYGEGNAAPVFM